MAKITRLTTNTGRLVDELVDAYTEELRQLVDMHDPLLRIPHLQTSCPLIYGGVAISESWRGSGGEANIQFIISYTGPSVGWLIGY